jgi:hypothetical protein
MRQRREDQVAHEDRARQNVSFSFPRMPDGPDDTDQNPKARAKKHDQPFIHCDYPPIGAQAGVSFRHNQPTP